ncbi:MAG TPA: universal stress protein [Candidatus Tectomicrobia bacterium]|nr:universal stress protein [Candidatus Tectomicrobia bacterium]
MFQHMLVPLDGSPQAEWILPAVVWLARRFGIPLTLLSVQDPDAAQPAAQPEGEGPQHLQGLAARLKEEGVQATSMVVVGRPAAAILRMAEQQGCNLIALSMSTHHTPGPGILGGVTDRVFHRSHIPLLLMPPQSAPSPGEPEGSIATLMVPLDGSPLAEAALPYAEHLAYTLGTELVLIRAVPFAGAYVDEATPPTGEREAHDYLATVADRLRAEEFLVRTTVFGGLAAPHIIDLAQATPHSLLVMTTHGRSALTRWFVGSVTEEVVRATVRPVLVIPRHYSRRYAETIAAVLARTPLFFELGQEDLAHLADAARIRTYRKGEVIVREGDPATGCFMIVSGRVEVSQGAASATPLVLATMGPGEVFGEMAVIDEHPRSATVRAIETTECVAIRRADFVETLRRHPGMAAQLLPVLVRRVRQAEARLWE